VKFPVLLGADDEKSPDFGDIQMQPSKPTQRLHDRSIGQTSTVIKRGKLIDKGRGTPWNQ
jgi:hypothetical protein